MTFLPLAEIAVGAKALNIFRITTPDDAESNTMIEMENISDLCWAVDALEFLTLQYLVEVSGDEPADRSATFCSVKLL